MTHPPLRAALALATLCGLAACYRPPAPSRVDAEIRSECRQSVDRQYNAQNRADLTRRDDRDVAFANSYNSGIASRGLGAAYGREQMVTDCLRANGDAASAQPGFGPALSPTSAGSAPSSLRP